MEDQNNLTEQTTERTGYCHPPKRTRFKKGVSGNPKGRPKGSVNMATALERAMREKVIINENGQRKTVTKLEAAVKQLANRAASGELKALALLAALVRSAEERANETTVSDSFLDEVDEAVALSILKRMQSANDGGQENNDASKS
jgi:adenine-specific DNA methylase